MEPSFWQIYFYCIPIWIVAGIVYVKCIEKQFRVQHIPIVLVLSFLNPMASGLLIVTVIGIGAILFITWIAKYWDKIKNKKLF